jgi:hypothetical protein
MERVIPIASTSRQGVTKKHIGREVELPYLKSLYVPKAVSQHPIPYKIFYMILEKSGTSMKTIDEDQIIHAQI